MRFVTTARSAVYYAKATLITKFLSAGDAIDVPFAVVGAGHGAGAGRVHLYYVSPRFYQA